MRNRNASAPAMQPVAPPSRRSAARVLQEANRVLLAIEAALAGATPCERRRVRPLQRELRECRSGALLALRASPNNAPAAVPVSAETVAVVAEHVTPDSPDSEEESGDPPPASAPSPAGLRRGEAHLWITRGLGNAGLLLGLVLDGDRWPDAPTFTARLLDCSDDTVRRWADELVGLRFVERHGGFLVATAAGRDRLHRCDPLPRRLLRAGVAGRTPAVLRAAAVVYGETLGMRAHRHGVRGDHERADLAGVHRGTVGKARKLLAAVGLNTFAEVRRGRAMLVRAAAVADKAGRPVGSHGRPLGDDARERIAEAAAKRRGTPAKTGRVTPARTGTPIQSPTETVPMQARRAPAADGAGSLRAADGCSEKQQQIVAASPDHRKRTETGSQVLDDLVPDLPAAKANRAEQAATSSERAVAELRRLAADPQTVPMLLRQPKQRATEQVLAAAGVFDRAPNKRAELAVQVGRVLDPVRVLVLALDVLLGRPKSIGATLRARLNRALAGNGELLTHCRASWPIGRFLEAVADGAEPEPARPVAAHRSAATVGAETMPATRPATPPPIGGGSFDDLLRGMGLGHVARRVTA